MNDVSKRLLSLDSVMERLDCSERQVRIIIEKGWLPAGKAFLGELRWKSEDVERFAEQWEYDALPTARPLKKKVRKPKSPPNTDT